MVNETRRRSAVKVWEEKELRCDWDEEISHAEQHISFSGNTVLITYILGSPLRLAGVGWLARRDAISFLHGYSLLHFISTSIQSVTAMANQPEKLADAQNKDAGEKVQETEEKTVVEAVPTVEEGMSCWPYCPMINVHDPSLTIAYRRNPQQHRFDRSGRHHYRASIHYPCFANLDVFEEEVDKERFEDCLGRCFP